MNKGARRVNTVKARRRIGTEIKIVVNPKKKL